jgi:nitroreductase
LDILLQGHHPIISKIKTGRFYMTNEPIFDTEQLNLLIRSRRSVFLDQMVKGKPIPDQLIWQLLENANWAPTHKHTEPWRFTVFSGDGLQKLGLFQAERYQKNAGEKFSQGKFDKFLRNAASCSHIIALAMKRSLDTNIPEVEEIAAVACAVQNIYLSVTAYGLGGYWSTGGVTYDEDAKSFFGLNKQDRLMGFFYLGYVQTPSPPATRMPVAEKTVWVR